MKEQFTPGPWHVIENSFYNSNIKGKFLVIDANGLLVEDGFNSLEEASMCPKCNLLSRPQYYCEARNGFGFLELKAALNKANPQQ